MNGQNTYHDDDHVPVLAAVSSADGKTIVLPWADPSTHRLLVSSSSGGGGFTELPATGAVNGTNAAFTFTQEPTYIVSDGVWYKLLDNNSNVNWSWNAGTLTATMTIPPSSAIWGFV